MKSQSRRGKNTNTLTSRKATLPAAKEGTVVFIETSPSLSRPIFLCIFDGIVAYLRKCYNSATIRDDLKQSGRSHGQRSRWADINSPQRIQEHGHTHTVHYALHFGLFPYGRGEPGQGKRKSVHLSTDLVPEFHFDRKSLPQSPTGDISFMRDLRLMERALMA